MNGMGVAKAMASCKVHQGASLRRIGLPRGLEKLIWIDSLLTRQRYLRLCSFTAEKIKL